MMTASQHVIFYFDKGSVGSNGIQFIGSRSQWQPKPGGFITDIGTFDHNTYFNPVTPLDTNTHAFYTTDGNTGAFNPTYYTPAQWQTLNEDLTSTFNTDPGFVAPSFAGGDNYNFSGAPPSGFVAIDYTKIGAFGPLPSIPLTVAPGFPLQLLDKNTDF